MDRANQYKQRHVPFGSSGARLVRAKKIEDRRKERRAEHLTRIRNNNIVENDSDEFASEPKKETREDRMTRLEKWKAERDLKKKLEAKNKKPIFKVGIPHRNIFPLASGGSPISHCHRRRAKQCQQVQTTLPKRITRATEKRLASKRALLEYCDTSAESYVAEPRKISKMKENKTKENSIRKKIDKAQYIAPTDYVFKGPSGVDPLPLFGRIWIPLSQESHTTDMKLSKESEVTPIQCESENLDVQQYQRHTFSTMRKCGTIVDKHGKTNSVPKCATMNVISGENDAPYMSTKEMNRTPRSCSPVPAEFSPYIVTSRGKKSARKEQRIRLGLNDSLADIIPTKDTVMQSMNISIEEEEKTAQYYKILLRQQTEKLTGLCAEWEKIQSDPTTTEDGKYMINQAIGQANLLMQKKFERFRGLVLDCETGKGEMLVRCRDLQAFWDIIMMQIKDCDLRFEKLSELKKMNWIESDVEVFDIEKKPIAKKKRAKIVKSSARAFIEAARKKNSKMTSNNSVTKVEKDEETQVESEYVIPGQDNLTTPQSKTRPLKNMEKLLDTSFTVMKVSRMGKTPEINLDSTVSYVNSNQTPGKSILKKSEDVERDCNFQKSAYKVNFNETVMTNEQIHDQIDHITSFSGAGRELDFSDDSYNEGDNKVVSLVSEGVVSSIPDVEVIPPTPNTKCPLGVVDSHSFLRTPNIDIVPPAPNVKTPRKTRVKLVETPINDPSMFNTRVLRNRAIATDNTPMKRCSNSKRSNSSTVRPHECSADHDTKENDFQTFNQRRSSRRSVKFDVDGDCTACSTVKPALTITSRRHQKLSTFGDMNHQGSSHISSNSNLISFDSPVTPRRRNRRTSKK